MRLKATKAPRMVTVRNLPPEVGKRLAQRARERKQSLSKAAVEALEESLLPKQEKPPGPPYHDLDFIIGSWTPEQADEFDRFLAETRRIDEEVWR